MRDLGNYDRKMDDSGSIAYKSLTLPTAPAASRPSLVIWRSLDRWCPGASVGPNGLYAHLPAQELTTSLCMITESQCIRLSVTKGKIWRLLFKKSTFSTFFCVLNSPTLTCSECSTLTLEGVLKCSSKTSNSSCISKDRRYRAPHGDTESRTARGARVATPESICDAAEAVDRYDCGRLVGTDCNRCPFCAASASPKPTESVTYGEFSGSSKQAGVRSANQHRGNMPVHC